MVKTPIQEIRELLEIQGNADPYNEDQYMRGMYNGLEFTLSVLENRAPVYRRKLAEKTSVDPLGIRPSWLKNIREPVHYGMDVGAPGGDQSGVMYTAPNVYDEEFGAMWNPRTLEGPFVAFYHTNWADEMRMLEGQAKWVPTSAYFKEQLRGDEEINTFDRVKINKLSAGILQQIEDCKMRLEESFSMPRDHWSTKARREGKTTSMLDVMKRALMDNQVLMAEIHVPAYVASPGNRAVTVEILSAGGASGGSGKALTFHGSAGNATQAPCALTIEDTDEPAGDREMDIVRSMCKGTR